MPVPKLQKDGFIFVWVINAKYGMCVNLLDTWGYRCEPQRGTYRSFPALLALRAGLAVHQHWWRSALYHV